ncbi:hypothetical protein N2152v2_010236 [Parachlorella kessleri]
MFSEAQLAKLQQKKRISQAEEAVASAVKEFEAQGVDLSGIIKTASGGDIGSHPALLAVKALDSAVGAAEEEGILAAMQELDRLVGESDGSSREALLTVLLRAEVVWALVRCLTSWTDRAEVLLPALRLLPLLLGGSREHQLCFRRAQGFEVLAKLLDKQAGHQDVVAAALSAAASGGIRSEEGKAAIMDGGLATVSLQLLDPSSGNAPPPSPELVQGACAVLNAVTNPDDDTQPSSRAFPNARALGKQGAAGVLVGALGQAQETGARAEVLAALCTALKQASSVAANEEICKEVSTAGGVGLALRILTTGINLPAIARPACSLLRQLASSDGVKAALLEAGGLEAVAQLLAQHPANYPLLEQGLGLVTNMTLRQPEAAARAVECGCADAILACLEGLLGRGEQQRTQHAVRQACMALRNIAARNPEIRPVLLEKGTEGVLRRVKQAFPGPAGALVRDCSSAALRDLGCDNYND